MPPPKDGRQRIYLCVEGSRDQEEAMEYLDANYADDPPDSPVVFTRKTHEIRLDRLTDNHIVIAVVRNINKDRLKPVVMAGIRADAPDVKGMHEYRAPVEECKPIDVKPFYTRATSRESDDVFDERGFVNALAKVCQPACPRVQRRGDGNGNHVRWLVLKWG